MSMQDTINFLTGLSQRLQHGGLLADQANEIGVMLNPHIDALKEARDQGTTIIDVTPTKVENPRTVVPFQAPAPPSQWQQTQFEPPSQQPSGPPQTTPFNPFQGGQ